MEFICMVFIVLMQLFGDTWLVKITVRTSIITRTPDKVISVGGEFIHHPGEANLFKQFILLRIKVYCAILQ